MAIEVTSVREERRRGLPRLGRRRPRAASRVRERAEASRKRAHVFRICALSLVVLPAIAGLTFAYFYISYAKIVDERLATGYLTSRAGIYAAPRVLRAGQSLTTERLVETLRRAGYVDSDASNVWSGRFSVAGASVEIEPRRTSADGGTATLERVRVDFDRRGHISSITGDGVPLQSYTLEPESLTNDAAMKTGKSAALSYDDIPPSLARAILSIEDRRFFEHNGLDPVGIARAVWSWTGASKDEDADRRQGGSTITQQLVKNTYLTPERTLRRKLSEAVLASVIERRLSKRDIFALYCNEIYLGQRGGVAVRGVEQAARVFFGKELKALTLAESATIAGMIQSPAVYAPDRHAERARTRRDTVIDAMLRDGAVTAEEAQAAKNEPVTVVPVEQRDATAPYFIDYVNRQVETRDGHDAAALRVHTTIDLELQQLAERAVRRQLDRLEKVYKGKRTPQAALVALDPRTGHILAMVGGNRYAESQLNRVSDARRQPGSVFKPFVYAAAFEGGLSPVSMSTDAPREFTYDTRARYSPANYGGGYSMRDVTLRAGLVRSLNVVTVDAAMRTGLERVAALAERFGLPKPAPYPSLALGTTEATPLEVATAYAALANGGTRVRPTAVTRAAGMTGDDEVPPASEQIVKPATAYMITDLLSAVVEEGTARAARGAFKGVAVAGKTGTSRDGWFAGYTPNLVCVVWVGFDDGEQLGLMGAESALPAWVEFVKGAVELRPELGGERFERPASVTTVEIDAETGLLASAGCPHRQRVALTPALVPPSACFSHNEPLAALTADYYEETATTSNVVVAPAISVRESTRAPYAPPVTASVYDADMRPAPRVEMKRNGRPTLTNEVRVTVSGEHGQRER
jgi:penicillin-binding protein 1B